MQLGYWILNQQQIASQADNEIMSYSFEISMPAGQPSRGCTDGQSVCDLSYPEQKGSVLKVDGKECHSASEGYQCGDIFLPADQGHVRYLPGNRRISLTLYQLGQKVSRVTVFAPITTRKERCVWRGRFLHLALQEVQKGIESDLRTKIKDRLQKKISEGQSPSRKPYPAPEGGAHYVIKKDGKDPQDDLHQSISGLIQEAESERNFEKFNQAVMKAKSLPSERDRNTTATRISVSMARTGFVEEAARIISQEVTDVPMQDAARFDVIFALVHQERFVEAALLLSSIRDPIPRALTLEGLSDTICPQK